MEHSTSPAYTVTHDPTKPRQAGIRARNGDLHGVNWTIPKGDFAHFLGYKPETAAEAAGDVSGRRVIELAMRDNLQELGQRAVHRYPAVRNLKIAMGRYKDQPGREREMLHDGVQSYSTAIENTHELNLRYLEMQYNMQQVGKRFTTVSQMMRVRHEAVKKAVNEVR